MSGAGEFMLAGVLKSGRTVEEAAECKAGHIARVATIFGVIVWRILIVTLLSRDHLDLPPDVLFTYSKIQVLTAIANHEDLSSPDIVAKAILIAA